MRLKCQFKVLLARSATKFENVSENQASLPRVIARKWRDLVTQASTHFPKERDDPTRSQPTPTLMLRGFPSVW